MRILISTIALASCGTTTTYDTTMPVELRGYYQEFVEDCRSSWRREACDRNLPRLKSIEWKNLEGTTIGEAWKKQHRKRPGSYYKIYIDPAGPDHRATLYHELGHVIGQRHQPNSCLMQAYYVRPELYGGWEQCKYQFFKIK